MCGRAIEAVRQKAWGISFFSSSALAVVISWQGSDRYAKLTGGDVTGRWREDAGLDRGHGRRRIPRPCQQ
jgi:hypothetical protein